MKEFLGPNERERLERILLGNLRAHLPMMQDLLAHISDDWCYEDGMYRFYYQSFKVFHLQEATQEIMNLLKKIAPEERDFCQFFREMLTAGTGLKFATEDNQHWLERTAPII